MNKTELLEKFYNNGIQIAKSVIDDIIDECLDKNLKILVFGLGYDSMLWYNMGKGNVYFVESNRSYIDLNPDIPKSNIIEYNYKNITVEKSFDMSIENINSYPIPEHLSQLAPFDVIIIDGPPGYSENRPGRLLPIYWTKHHLSKKGTIVYVDDSKRKLESHCINRFLLEHKIKNFPERSGCDKFLL